jgi:hypothetical protein
MSVSDKIFRTLEKAGFEVDDDGRLYKALIPNKIALYFEKESDAGGPYLGIWMVQSISSTKRNNLKVELHNIALGKNCSDVCDETDGDGGYWIWCEVTALNDSILDWIVSTMEELERRALFEINK